MPLAEYKCCNEECARISEEIVKNPIPERIDCPACQCKAIRIMSAHGTYKINGNNSASVTPKKHRGGR